MSVLYLMYPQPHNLSIKALSPCSSGGGEESGFEQMFATLPPASCCTWNKGNFPFHPSGLFIGFRVANSQGCPTHSFQQHYLMVPPAQSITTPTVRFELCLSTTTEIKPGTSEMSVFPVYCSSLYILAFSCICIFCFSLWSLCQNISSHREYLNYLCKHSEDISCSLHSVYYKVHKQ